MKRLLIATALAGLMAGPALADGMDNAVGNTVRVIIDDAGNGFDAYFDADGAYSDSLGRSGASWTVSGSELCLNPPEGAMNEDGTPATASCGPWNPDLAVGDSWQTDGWGDGMITISILEGRGHTAPTPPVPGTE
ncbi:MULTISPECIES: hypothetical protein [Hyphobacterium]|uniref:Uncharacterized protein n=1 Tax=Hyphobacterium vulgare TaxID=1736751 RepID=A0ABV6ZZ35_9PROT